MDNHQPPDTTNATNGAMAQKVLQKRSTIRPHVPLPANNDEEQTVPVLGGYAHLVWEMPTNPTASALPRIYLGSCQAASRPYYKYLKEAGIGAILNCTKDFPCYHKDHDPAMLYGQMAIDDIESADLITYLPGATAFLRHCLCERHTSVLVHCMVGMSRSTSVVLAYLMEYEHMDLDQAYIHVKQRRSLVYPNHGFWKQLCAYQERCRTSNDEKQTIDKDWIHDTEWIKQSTAWYACCRDTVSQKDLYDRCFGAILQQTAQKDSDLRAKDSTLEILLDYVWGRGVLQVELDWLAILCSLWGVEPERVKAIVVDDQQRTEFASNWTGEIYPAQVGRLMTTLEAHFTSQPASLN